MEYQHIRFEFYANLFFKSGRALNRPLKFL